MSSYDQIEHLDFEPGAEWNAVPLRERAAAALKQARAVHEQKLLQVAAAKIADVLGEWSGQLDSLKVTNLETGDGEVWVTIDGMHFRVATLTIGASTDDPKVQATLTVRVNDSVNPLTISTLARLAELIEEDRVVMDALFLEAGEDES